MSYTRSEYIETITISQDDLQDFKYGQQYIRTRGYVDQNEDYLKSGLNAVSSILAFAFMLPTPVQLAAGVISFVTSWPSELDEIIEDCQRGEDFLNEAFAAIYNVSNADVIKLKVSYLEFVDEGYRIATQGEILGIHTPNGWILP